MRQLKHVVENFNPDLMIIPDDVYSTFADDFTSIMADLPYNTIGVYSYSKYFSYGMAPRDDSAFYEDNVFDKLIREQDEDRKQRARKRYAGLSTDPDSILFIDRIVVTAGCAQPYGGALYSSAGTDGVFLVCDSGQGRQIQEADE